MRTGLRLAVLAGAITLAPAMSFALDGVDDPVFEERATLTGNYLAGRLAGNAGDNRAAAQFYSRALGEDPENTALLERLFLSELSNGNVNAALVHADELTEQESSNRYARFALALRDLRGRNFSAARRHLDAIQPGTLADLTTGLVDAWALRGLGQTDEAVAAVEQLTGPDWYGLFKNVHLGLINDVAGNTDLAREYLEAAYSVESGTLRIVEAKARFEARSGNRDTALKVLSAFDKIVPGHPDIVRLAIQIESGEAISPLVNSPLQGAGDVFLGIGMALSREGGEDIATLYLRLASYALDDSSMALAGLADVYERHDRHDEAIAVYEKIAIDEPIRRSADTKRALNLDAIEQTDEAVALLRGLIVEDPQDNEPIMALGNIFRARERFTEAAETYSLVIDKVKNPTRRHWLVYYYRGIAHERSKQWPKAEADLLKALELLPDQPLVLNYLGYSWVNQGVHLERGLEMIKKAVAQRPRDGYIVDSLGWVYYRLGRYEEAVTHLERAVELRPQDPVINDHLGDAYWRAGRKLEARFQWSHARDLDPEPEDLKKILAKLGDGLPSEDVDRAASGGDEKGG